MKTAFLMLGLLVGGDHTESLVTVATPIAPAGTHITVGKVFDDPVPADIQMIEPAFEGSSSCNHCCGNGCGGCGHGCLKYDLCNPPTDMVPHTPYFAEPKTYYYFRPYNWAHVLSMQTHATSWGVDPATPYSNKLFQDVYAQIQEEIDGDAASDSAGE